MRISPLLTLTLVYASAMQSALVASRLCAADGVAESTAATEENFTINAAPSEPAELITGPEILTQPFSVGSAAPEELPAVAPDRITIDELIQLAIGSNPSVAQASARVAALRGKWVQAGLPPNPTAGYVASEVGNDGHGGQQGGFAGQEFVTGGKLRLDQAVVAQEIQQAEQRLYATQLRVATDVRRAGYAVLVAQRRIELADELSKLSGQAIDTSRKLLEAGDITPNVVWQSELEQQNAILLFQSSRNQYSSAWRQLTAVIGNELPPQTIDGDITQLPAMLDWDEQLARVTATSPELGAAFTEVMRANVALRRATVEPIPNISTQVMVQYDDHSNYTIAGVQAGIPLPLWNRNQGGIRQARAEVAQARRNAVRVELDLKRRLAEAFQSYATANAQAETYATSILPKARQTLELVQQGYPEQFGDIILLTAQRTYSQTHLAYLDALAGVWAGHAEIEGLLLSGSLSEAPN